MIGRLAWVILALASPVLADPAADKLAVAGVAEFSGAFRAWDGARFSKAAGIFAKAAGLDPASSTARVWQGTALFHQMLCLKNPPSGKPDSGAADATMDSAIDVLESAVTIAPPSGEAHALLGTLYGMKIHGGLIGAIRYGPRVQEHQREALKHGATNPRVKYLLGAGLLHTAKDEAGKREALATLLAAEKLFVHETKRPAGPLAPRWGYSSCLTFIGRAHEALGEKPEALSAYRRALAAHPADHTAAAGIQRLGGH